MTRMKYLVLSTVVATLAAAPNAHADLICPSGSLSDMLPDSVWAIYADRNSEYVNRWLRRLSENLASLADSETPTDAVEAASEAGEDNALVMYELFKEGFIAAADFISAYCVEAPQSEPWNETIKKNRQQQWCEQWPDAHFCPLPVDR